MLRNLKDEKCIQSSLLIVVFGASGDLARKKTFPALLELSCFGLLPTRCTIVGYARSPFTSDSFRDYLMSFLRGKESKCNNVAEVLPSFMRNLQYFQGLYDSDEDFSKLANFLNELEDKSWKECGCETIKPQENRIFFLDLPPKLFIPCTKGIRKFCFASSSSSWNRVVVEKPFGKDLISFRKTNSQMLSILRDEEMYRIDHYLGKGMVENIIVMRFANVVYEAIFNRNLIKKIRIIFKEDFGVEGRAGYFDDYGVIRDVMQNHLIQVLALIIMETPASLNEKDIKHEKIRALRKVRQLSIEDVIVGQYSGYTEEKDIPKDSKTPTYAKATFYVDNSRWKGVPFELECGKALNERKSQVVIEFIEPMDTLFPEAISNSIIIDIQPNEQIVLKQMSIKPGLKPELAQTELNLSFKQEFGNVMPEAYERLINEIIYGDHSLFVSTEELDASWLLFENILGGENEEKLLKNLKIYKPGIHGFHSS